MELSKLSDLNKQPEFSSVEFIARVTDICNDVDNDNDTDRLIIKIFDGFNNDRFIVYGLGSIIPKLLSPNNVYKFSGKAQGNKRRYFSLKGFEEVPITLEIEHKYFPERFQKPTTQMLYIYKTYVAKIHDGNLREFVKICLGLSSNDKKSDKQKATYERFVNSPASLKHHDNYSGGYVAHISGMLMIVDNLENDICTSLRKKEINNIDWDLLRALVYLHDVGKPLTYIQDSSNIYRWNENYLEDHAVIGSHYVYDVWRTTKLISLQVMQKLCYGISTHMNNTKNINDNKIPELKILKAIDMLEATIADIC